MKQLNFEKLNGLIPVVIQDILVKEVLMLGFMTKQALQKTIETNTVWFWSRTRKRLWMKGETSGNVLKVVKILPDCDGDTLLILVRTKGKNICHTGERSCFN